MNIPILFIPSWAEVVVWRDDSALLDGDTARDYWNDANDPAYFWETEGAD